jgi:thiamine-phosphate pyrophosphorylase
MPLTLLPPLYAIIDASCFPDDSSLFAFARELAAAGVTLVQYRNKQGSARQILSHARELKHIFTASAQATSAKEASHAPGVRLIMNDRADLCLAAGFDGVHIGQDDLSPQGVRSILGPKLWMGVSTHNPDQVAVADLTDATYLAVGPVFATSSKANPDPLIGLEGVGAARQLTRKPLVAIGGITRANFRDVLAAGADSLAVIGDLLKEPRRASEEFFI